jgi:hypothetical protein
MRQEFRWDYTGDFLKRKRPDLPESFEAVEKFVKGRINKNRCSPASIGYYAAAAVGHGDEIVADSP